MFGKGRPRIVLTMIVKNEAHVIRRCLESVKPHIDAWVISDTGSTDGTQALIRELLSGIPGELLERPWVDFSTNRNEAIEHAEKHFSPDYCLTLDADEELTTSAGFSLNGLALDAYDAMFEMEGTAQRWPRKLLFRPHLRYRYVLDEVLEGKSCGLLPACLVKSYLDSARSADGVATKYARDAEVLRKAAEAEPDQPRYWFYLAQRLSGSGQYEAAIEAYKRRLAIPGGTQAEHGVSRLMIGQCLEQLGRPLDEVLNAYLEAYRTNPNRAEPLFAIASIYAARKDFPLAELYARAAQRVPRPNDPLTVDESVYSYRAVDLLAGVLAEQGKLDEARGLLEKLVALPQLPEDERPRVLENIQKIRDAQAEDAPKEHLGPDEFTYQSQADAVRSGGLKAFRRMGLEYLTSFQAQSLPAPVRWLWIALLVVFGRALPIAGAATCAPLAAWAASPLAKFQPLALLAVAASPLLYLAGRRRLQDAPIAALTLAALGFAVRGEPIGTGLAIFALLAMKEAAVLTIPAIGLAWAFSRAGLGEFAITWVVAVGAWGISLLALFGETALPILRAGAAGHESPYTKDHQQGAWHRLIVDLVLVSPLATFAALFGPWKLLAVSGYLIAAHAIAPVRNVRLVLAADLLLRVCAVAAFGWWALPALAADIYISRRLRAVYDPVTAALTSQLGMSR